MNTARARGAVRPWGVVVEVSLGGVGVVVCSSGETLVGSFWRE